MASRFSPWSGQHLFGIVSLMLVLAGGIASAQDGPGSLPALPGVPDEVATSSSAAAPSSAPAAFSNSFASEAEARDLLREAFARREYSRVLGLADRIHAQFPQATFTRYYEETARLQIHDRGTDAEKLPFRRLDSLPPSSVIHAMTRQTSSSAAPARPEPSTDSGAKAPSPLATPAPAATPAPPAPSAQAAPPPRATAPPAPAPTKIERIKYLFAENRQYAMIGGGGLLVLIGLAGLMLRRRRAAASEEEPAEDLFGAPVPEMQEVEEVAAARGSGTTAFFRSEVQAMANGWASSMESPVAAPPADAPEENILKPDIEPIFALAEENEPVGPAPVRAEDPHPPIPEGREIVLEQDVVNLDDIPIDLSDEPIPAAEDSIVLAEESLPAVDEPDLPGGQVGESLYIDEAPVSFEEIASGIPLAAPPVKPPAPEPEATDLPTVSPEGSEPGPDAENSDAGLTDLPTVSLEGSVSEPASEYTEPAAADEESIRMAADETQTAFPEFTPGEETVVSMPGPEEGEPGDETIVSPLPPDEAPPPGEAVPEGFQAFHPGQTVTFNPDAEDAPVASGPPPAIPPLARPKEVKVDPQDVPEDVFEREYKAGLREAEACKWIDAIHHLSIAAALRPGAIDVKEHLREARRMRARELEGRG